MLLSDQWKYSKLSGNTNDRYDRSKCTKNAKKKYHKEVDGNFEIFHLSRKDYAE